MAEGDIVILRDGDFTVEAEVQSVYPSGGFSCHWYAGSNRYAPKLPGHYCAVFKADGTNEYKESRWEFAGMKDGKP